MERILHSNRKDGFRWFSRLGYEIGKGKGTENGLLSHRVQTFLFHGSFMVDK